DFFDRRLNDLPVFVPNRRGGFAGSGCGIVFSHLHLAAQHMAFECVEDVLNSSSQRDNALVSERQEISDPISQAWRDPLAHPRNDSDAEEVHEPWPSDRNESART